MYIDGRKKKTINLNITFFTQKCERDIFFNKVYYIAMHD